MTYEEKEKFLNEFRAKMGITIGDTFSLHKNDAKEIIEFIDHLFELYDDARNHD